MLWGSFVCLVFLFLIYLLIKKHPFLNSIGIHSNWIYVAFLSKLFGGLLLYALYSYHYSDRSKADIFKYYDDAQVIFDQKPNSNTLVKLFVDSDDRDSNLSSLLSETQHWDRGELLLPNDHRSMIKVNLLLMYISRDFYFFHLIFFSFLSFLGSWALFRFFKEFKIAPDLILLSAIFLPPSILIWTSGMLKESLFLFSLGFLLYFLMSLSKKVTFKSIGLVLFFGFLLLSIKSYLAICLLPSILLYFLYKSVGLRNAIVVSFSMIGLIFFLLKDLFLKELIRMQSSFIQLASETSANSRFDMHVISDLADFILQIPYANYNVWLRPLIPQKMGMLDLLNLFESWGYLILLLVTVIFFRKRNMDNSLLIISVFCLLFIGLVSVLIGSSIPILGAIVRYRSPLIIFFLISLFTFVDWKKLRSKLPIKQ